VDVRRALDVIADHFGVPAGEVREDMAFQADLGADSLDLIELSMRLETEFEVQINDDETERCDSVCAALALLKQKLAHRSGPELANAA
jgi:acyl carrier protein